MNSVTIPSHVTIIGAYAFAYCSSLLRITIPGSVTSIGDGVFASCLGLTGIYFQGDAPIDMGSYVFEGVSNVTVYYVPNTKGWGLTFEDHPTQLLSPRLKVRSGDYTGTSNGFGFDINWASGKVVVVAACTNLSEGIWIPVVTNTPASDSFHFVDPQSMNSRSRFYRLRTP